MSDDKILLLKRHPCSEDLSDDAVRDIAEQCTLVKSKRGDYLLRANERCDSVYLLVHGRVKQSIIDFSGNVLFQRYQTEGTQIGALTAALRDPAPVEVIAEEPTTLLRLDHQSALHLTKQYEQFRSNFSKMIADSVLNMIMKDRHQQKPVQVAVFHQSKETQSLTRRLIQRLRELGEVPHILSDQTDWQPIDGVPFFSLIEDGKYVTGEEVQRQVNAWIGSKRTFVDVQASIDIEPATKIAAVSGKILWCVTPDNWRDSLSKLEAIVAKAPGWREKINVVWVLPGDTPRAPLAPEFKQLAKRDFKVSFDAPPKNQSRELVNGLERIIHQLRGVRIGLALGGGAARGMAHLGVLKVLEENGIIFDMIAGTSAGAMTGILYASGMEPDYNVDRFVKDLRPSWLFRHMPNGGYWYLLYKYRRGQFDPMLRKYLDDSRLEQLPIPAYSITVDLVSGQPVVRESGDCVHAITESINLPGLSTPINRDGRALVDGGIVNNIPANVLAASGCNFVIAVSVTTGIEKEFASNRPDTPTAKMKSASSISTILRSYIVQNVNMNSVGVAPADYVIQPDLTDFDITEFARADEMSAIGATTALESITKLKQLLSSVDREMFA